MIDTYRNNLDMHLLYVLGTGVNRDAKVINLIDQHSVITVSITSHSCSIQQHKLGERTHTQKKLSNPIEIPETIGLTGWGGGTRKMEVQKESKQKRTHNGSNKI